MHCLPRTEPCAAYEAKYGKVRRYALQLGFARAAFPAQQTQLCLLHVLAFILNSAATPALARTCCKGRMDKWHVESKC